MEKYILDKESYTLNEIAEITGHPKSRFQTAARRGKLVEVDDRYRAKKARFYTKQSILAYLEDFEAKQQIEGISVTTLAKDLSVYPNQIYNLLATEGLETLQVGETSNRILLPPETEAAIRKHFEEIGPRYIKSGYYNKRHDILLYQAFVDNHQNMYRVIKRDDEWGFTSPSGQFVRYEEFVESYNVSTKYKIHGVAYVGNPYTEIVLPLNNSLAFELYDVVIPIWGVENLRMQSEESELVLQLRSRKYPITPSQHERLSRLLPHFLKSNYYILETDSIEMLPSLKKISVEIPFEQYERLMDYLDNEKSWTLKKGMTHAIDLLLKERS